MSSDASQAPRSAPVQDGTLLLIDDDESFRGSLHAKLQNWGYSVESFESGLHAFRFMEGKPWSWAPRLVITDIVMDGMGGYQVMQRLEQLYPRRNIPCVIVSKLSSSDYRYEAEAAGAAAYLPKPLDESELRTTLEELLTKKKKKKKP